MQIQSKQVELSWAARQIKPHLLSLEAAWLDQAPEHNKQCWTGLQEVAA